MDDDDDYNEFRVDFLAMMSTGVTIWVSWKLALLVGKTKQNVIITETALFIQLVVAMYMRIYEKTKKQIISYANAND